MTGAGTGERSDSGAPVPSPGSSGAAERLERALVERDAPGADADIESLVRVSWTLATLRDVAPPPRGLQPGRSQFIAAGVAQAESAGRPWWQRWWRGRAPVGGSWRLRFGVAASLLVILLLGARATTSAAAAALPGDALYPVKRAAETVGLALADRAERPALERKHRARRLSEVRALTNAGRVAAVTFTCEVVAIDVGGRHVSCAGLPGVTVQLAPAVEGPAQGAVVEVRGRTVPRGAVLASGMTLLSAPAPAQATTTPTATEAPPVTRTPSPSEPPTDPPDEPTGSPPTAPSPTPEATATPTMLADAGPPSEASKPTIVRWEGVLERATGEMWEVAGQSFRRSGGVVDTSRGPATEGALVVVEAERRDGELWLVRLTVLEARAEPVEVEFAGTLDDFSATAWTVDGRRVHIVPDTLIEGHPAVGRLVRVRALRHPEGRLDAVHLVVQTGRIVEFTGALDEIAVDAWVVAGREIVIGPTTTVEGEPRIGALVDVRAEELATGSLLGLRLAVRPPATPNPSPTAGLPLPSPSPELVPHPTTVFAPPVPLPRG